MLDSVLGSTELNLVLASAAVGGIMIAVYLANLVTVRAGRAEQDFIDARGRLPAAARLDHVEHLLREREGDLRAADERLERVRQEVAEAERAKIDAAQWRDLAEQAKRDYDALDEERREVDRVRAEHERALVDLGQARGELETTRHDRARALEEIEALTGQVRMLEDKQRELLDLDAKIAEKQSALEVLRAELAQTQDMREELRTAKFELEESRRRLASLEDRSSRLTDEVTQLADRRKSLEAELRPLEELRQDRDRLLREADELAREIEDLGARRNGLEATVGTLSERAEALRTEIEELKAKKYRGRAGAPTTPDNEAAVADLRRHPSALFDAQRAPLLQKPEATRDEKAALARVQDHLHSLGLIFDARLVQRFHTCLKTGRISPLTVLAGISGTGKSQLPQRYAEAMGMHFLKIAVQPRWDGPQDLFGFYNYLEEKYRATELARALVYMDVLGNPLVDDKEWMRERMLLVLLDEMNLARVEYYFSEFLSRLEGRPGPDINGEEHVRPSRIEIEVGIEEEGRRSVYAGHNVLFVGTMNEDESTQSLSDKVLDRANVLRFQRPKQLAPELRDGGGTFTPRFLPFKTWLEWHRPVTKIPRGGLEFAEGFIGTLNEELSQLRRPFGHRINQAILSYVANHPDADSMQGCRNALSDMLQLRILPKLRGIEIDERALQALQRIEQLVRDKLSDDELADTVSAAANQSDTFDWMPPA